LGGPGFDRIGANASIRSFLSGAGPAVVGAIAGSAIPLGLALQHGWQVPLLAAAALWLLVIRRGVVSTLLIAGALGVVLALAGAPV
jgi:chromate transporter